MQDTNSSNDDTVMNSGSWLNTSIVRGTVHSKGDHICMESISYLI